MSRQEVLIVGILQIANHNRTACHKDILFEVGVQMDRIDDFAAETDRKIKLSALALCRGCLTQSTIGNVRLSRRSDLGVS